MPKRVTTISPTVSAANEEVGVSRHLAAPPPRLLQRRLGNAAVAQLAAGRDEGAAREVMGMVRAARGRGRPLPAALRAAMESSLGADLGDVRLHTDQPADALNRAVGARAFATGADIFFRAGEYRPGSAAGRAVIGHELAHVLQQRAGRVAAPGGAGLPINASDALEAEADTAGGRAARGEAAAVRGSAGAPTSAGATPIQCMKFTFSINGQNVVIDAETEAEARVIFLRRYRVAPAPANLPGAANPRPLAIRNFGASGFEHRVHHTPAPAAAAPQAQPPARPSNPGAVALEQHIPQHTPPPRPSNPGAAPVPAPAAPRRVRFLNDPALPDRAARYGQQIETIRIARFQGQETPAYRNAFRELELLLLIGDPSYENMVLDFINRFGR